MVVVGVRKKMPSDGAQFSKRASRHRRNQKPHGLNVWRQVLQKRGEQKKLIEMNITRERKEIISSFERNRPLRASPKTFRSGRAPSHAQDLSFTTVSGGALRVQRKIWAAADFQNFLARPNTTRRPRKKRRLRNAKPRSTEARREMLLTTFLVSHVITGIVVNEVVISKNRRLGAHLNDAQRSLACTAAWSSSLSSTSSSGNLKTAASFCRCTRSAGACRHRSISELFLPQSWVSFLHQVGSFAAPFGLGAAALARCVFIWIVASIERTIALHHHGRARSSRLSCSVQPQCIFSGGLPAVTGKSVVMRTLRKEQSCR